MPLASVPIILLTPYVGYRLNLSSNPDVYNHKMSVTVCTGIFWPYRRTYLTIAIH